MVGLAIMNIPTEPRWVILNGRACCYECGHPVTLSNSWPFQLSCANCRVSRIIFSLELDRLLGEAVAAKQFDIHPN